MPLLLAPIFCATLLGMKVFILAALTADGLIGRDATHLADWTSSEDKKLFVKLTKKAGVIVMGSKTYGTIGRVLPGRRMVVYTRQPDDLSTDGVETTSEPPRELIKRLESEGAKGIAVCGGASIYDLFMEAGVVDELYLTIEPLLFGKGVSLFSHSKEAHLELLDSHTFSSGTIQLHYAVKR
jgi:dihydrofolate reductase